MPLTRSAASEPVVTGPRWQQALAYALTGRRFPELDPARGPDPEAVAGFLRSRLGTDLDPAELQRPHPLPDDLAVGIGAAQLWAAVSEVRRRLDPPAPGTPPVVTGRPLTADERGLLRDVPPHHGS